MAKEIGIGLVGYGGIGRVHALCFQMLPIAYPELPRVRVVAVSTAREASSERARRELGWEVRALGLEGLLGSGDVTVVDCCAPTASHAAIVSGALEAGKALFCEKPLAASAEESARLVRLAEGQGLTAGMNFHFRFIPALQEARRRIQAGALGEIYGFHLRYHRASNLKRDRPMTWRFSGQGGGVLVDLGSHLIDLVFHLLGPVASVSARTRTVIAERPDGKGGMARVDTDDLAHLQLELRNGAFGTLEVSKVVPGAGDDVRVEAYGEKGALVFDTQNPNGLEFVERDREGGGRWFPTHSRTLPPASAMTPEASTGWIQWHLASLAAFLHALEEGAPPSPHLTDGLRVDQVIEAARRSAGQGGAPVRLS